MSIKEMTKEQYAAYRHTMYEKYKLKRRAYQKAYYAEHREDVLKKAHKRYRRRCGLL